MVNKKVTLPPPPPPSGSLLGSYSGTYNNTFTGTANIIEDPDLHILELIAPPTIPATGANSWLLTVSGSSFTGTSLTCNNGTSPCNSTEDAETLAGSVSGNELTFTMVIDSFGDAYQFDGLRQ